MSHERRAVSNDGQLDCWNNSYFRLTKRREHIKTPHHWPFVRGIHAPVADGFPSQRVSTMESLLIAWRYHGFTFQAIIENTRETIGVGNTNRLLLIKNIMKKPLCEMWNDTEMKLLLSRTFFFEMPYGTWGSVSVSEVWWVGYRITQPAWSKDVVILTKFWSLGALKVVKMTTCIAANVSR